FAQAELHRGAHRFLAGAMAEAARLAPALGPAAVAVHDDGDVPGQPAGLLAHRHRGDIRRCPCSDGGIHGGPIDRAGQIAINSSSLALTTPSTSLTYWSVSFWMSSSARCSSSS